MNFISAGCRLNKEIKKCIAQSDLIYRNIDQKIPEEVVDRIKETRINEMREGMRTGLRLWSIFLELKEELIDKKVGIKGHYFITIRPDPKQGITFDTFKERCLHFVDRNIIDKYKLTFEQKGESMETLGTGFHTHIIVKVIDYVRSKGELLRYAQTSFKNICDAQCIQVDRLANQSDVDNVDSYITTYTSKDGHKEPTMEWDTLWRTQNLIDRFYESRDTIIQYIDNNACPYQVHGGQAIEDENENISLIQQK